MCNNNGIFSNRYLNDLSIGEKNVLSDEFDGRSSGIGDGLKQTVETYVTHFGQFKTVYRVDRLVGFTIYVYLLYILPKCLT